MLFILIICKLADQCCRSGPAPQRPATHRALINGYTLIELLVIAAILVVLANIVMVAYSGYSETAKVASAIQQIRVMSLSINDYKDQYQHFPDSLEEVGQQNVMDPWGHPYVYLNIETVHNNGRVRKDHNLVPLNTDYDLYSMGKDGQSVPPLTARSSRDDIVRANNGGFVGKASDY